VDPIRFIQIVLIPAGEGTAHRIEIPIDRQLCGGMEIEVSLQQVARRLRNPIARNT
jgi:hypothetical protein